ncbi:2-amino-4-hydroxy-6-hydroxymethyldihydropteridine diphosphokinase [Taylorella asinigenitalis]|uniref:2-amino-4-hydroxy-6-hydroxymethyldihydropteridine pyrophosphokinase n=1 Tax=Taylorella asinigenitalis (strain MCE3) TaxID=1008459 RepID=G4QBL1_TAYAM|nr:2-amino-4-hydroxy-6-hydroxymethyldihydropteridine diphosphokinase [Taylorella asinigenitalis]AEP36989.1 2-amino-4-hydroxy-6- hydroxymethyldihydropteridine pyrophosphokinase [Taylorella asinigenitalis MCE3]
MHKVFIGLGANLGDELSYINKAISKLVECDDIELLATSSVYKTSPVESDGEDYLNAVIQINTSLDPFELLSIMQKIELDLGRQRPYKNAPRTIDLDILLFDDMQIKGDRLTIPHPRITQRAFVLVPLRELNPDLEIGGQSLETWIANLPCDQKIEKTTYSLNP